MSSLLAKVFQFRMEPIRSIEWVIAFFTFVGGLYIFSPLYAISAAQNGPTAMASAFSHPYMILFWGIILLGGSVAVMFGLWKKKPHLKSTGWFAIFLARTYQLITTFVVTGFLPITWIYPLTLTVIIIILWAIARYEAKYSV